MAYVVARGGGRFELRESSLTKRGPRARTLATFKVLSDEVVDHAEARSCHALDRAGVRQSARRAGAPVAAPVGDARAGALLGVLADGWAPTPVRARLVAHALLPHAVDAPPDHLQAAGEWVGVETSARGDALRDLLSLVDAVPARPRTKTLRFPRLSSAA
jgi:hypothetical protein